MEPVLEPVMAEALVLFRAAAVAVLLVEPDTGVLSTNTSGLLLGPSLLPSMMSHLGHLDPPLIELPSLVDGLFDPGLLDERVAE